MPSGLNVAEEIRAAIGDAVSNLLRSGMPVTRLNIITMLQIRGSQTMDVRQKQVCQDARTLLGGLFR